MKTDILRRTIVTIIIAVELRSEYRTKEDASHHSRRVLCCLHFGGYFFGNGQKEVYLVCLGPKSGAF